MEKPNNTLSDPGIEPRTPCSAVALATTRPTRLKGWFPTYKLSYVLPRIKGDSSLTNVIQIRKQTNVIAQIAFIILKSVLWRLSKFVGFYSGTFYTSTMFCFSLKLLKVLGWATYKTEKWTSRTTITFGSSFTRLLVENLQYYLLQTTIRYPTNDTKKKPQKLFIFAGHIVIIAAKYFFWSSAVHLHRQPLATTI